ncbi:heterogeneous nuclear ribonucleoprotein U-like protein 1 isoform X2 [Macrobrachium rosenbergii]|uniref:heterogeneous nuclear ribonucleoprotein U-like protein 1 isoform X2 n=1 Tax=Macrobrachium rosenbergii TaxID=79674 RepID=UPI0034D75F92
MDRQYMPYWPSGPGQYPPIKEEPDYSKMGYEDTPGGGAYGIKREPDADQEGPPPRTFSANVKVEPPEIKQEFAEPKQEPFEERRGEKRQASSQQGPPDSKRYRHESTDKHTDDDPDYDKEAVILDWYNSDLSLIIDKETFLSAKPMTSDGFAYVWHGVRARYGFLRGRLFYEVKVEDHLAVPHLEEEQHPHVVRCGWSIDDAGMTLGEEPFSYGYGGTAKASTDLKFKDYGRPFGKGDVIGCFLDMDSEPITMSFSVNGRNFGKCYEVSHRSLQGKALFPHILTKNCTFKVNFGSEYPWFQPMARYTFVGQIPLEERVLGAQGPETRQDSEVIMMVGLPACGKTTWVEKYCKEHPEKKFYVLGTNFLIDKMKVNGLARKRNYHGRWDALIEKCTKCLNKLLEISYQRKRNFIIDQTNVYPSARRRKMKGFPGFYRRAVVLIPDDAEFQRRTEKQIRQEGKNVPDSAVLEMKANFTIPEVDDEIFDAVDFVELNAEEAGKLVEQYNQEAQRAGYVKKPVRGGRGGGNFRGGWNRDRNSSNSRGGYNRDNFGGNSRDSNSDQSSEGSRGGFGRESRGGFGRGSDGGRGGFGNRGGFNRGDNGGGFGRGGESRFDRGSESRFDRGGESRFDRGGDNSRSRFDQGGDNSRGDGNWGGFDRSSDDGGRGGFGRGTDSNRGGFGRGGDSSRGGFGRGGFGNRDGPGGYGMDRDNQGYRNNNESYQRDNELGGPRGFDGDRSSGNRDFDRSDDNRGRYGQNNFGRNRDSFRSFDKDNRGGDNYNSGGFGQSNFGGNRDMTRGLDMDRGNRDFSRGGGDSGRGSYGRDNYGGNSRDNNRGFGFDNGDRGNFSRDTQRSMDRDYNRGGSDNFGGNFGSSNRSYSMDRERDSRSESSSLGGYSRDSFGGSNRGFGSHDNLRNMGGGGGSSGYGNFDQSDRSSGYSSLSSSSGSLSSAGGPNQGSGWNSYNQQQYWGQNDGGYANQQMSGPNQQSYGRPFDHGNTPGEGSGGWGQQSGGGNLGGSGPGGQPWNYGSNYRGQRP